MQHYTAPGCLGGRGLATIGGDVLSAGYDGTICRFDGATGAVVQTYVDPEPGPGRRLRQLHRGGRQRRRRRWASSSAVRASRCTSSTGRPARSRKPSAARSSARRTTRASAPPWRRRAGCSSGPAGTAPASTTARPTPSSATGGPRISVADCVARHRHRRSSARASRSGPTRSSRTSARGSMTVFDRCGNGVLSPAEQCDDGNTTSGDGCSATCRLELLSDDLPGRVPLDRPARLLHRFAAEARHGPGA